MSLPLTRVASLIFDQPLAILPERLNLILRSLGPRFSSVPLPSIEDLGLGLGLGLGVGIPGSFGYSDRNLESILPSGFQAGAIPSHSTATSSGSWDGPANESRLKLNRNGSYYRKFYAWVDSAADDTKKSSYKFGHHDVDGDGAVGSANLAGCRAVIANLNGARSAPHIPDSDRKGVWNHVAKHLRDGGEEPAPLKSKSELTRLGYQAYGLADNYDSDANADKPYALTASGIAIIPIKGALLKKGGWLSSASGCSSYSQISSAFSAALDDSSVLGILLDIDSPGGTTHGCFELSDLIHAARRDKPIYACANDLAASAAYALASAASEVWLTRTAAVGSIGVYALHADQSGADEQAGIAYTYIYAGDKKVDGNPHEPLSRVARKDIQAEIDRERDMFVACVARNRSVDEAKLLALEAGIRFAGAACPLLADRVGTIDDCLAALSAEVDTGGGRSGRSGRQSGRSERSGEKDNHADAHVLVVQSYLDQKAEGATDMPFDLQAALTGATTEELQAALAARREKDSKEAEPKAGKEECSACHGTGEVDGEKCEACDGSGYVGKAAKVTKDTKAAKPKGKDNEKDKGDGDDGDDDDDDGDDDDDDDGDEKKPKGRHSSKADDMKKGRKAGVKKEKEDKDEEDEENMDDEKKGSKAAADRIMSMCELAGVTRLATVRSYIERHTAGRLSIADITAKLLDARADAQRSESGIDSSIAVPLNAGNALVSIMQGSRQVQAANPGMSRSEALEHFVRTHPQAYDQYQNDREIARISGAHRAAYMSSIMPIMKSMGLAASGAVGVTANSQLPGSITGAHR